MSQSIALGIAFGAAFGAVFDFIAHKKSQKK
jgi:hypothetical protein